MKHKSLSHAIDHVLSPAGKIGWSVILGGLMLIVIGYGGGKDASAASNSSANALAKQTIAAYFTTYFNSQKTLNYTKMNSNILADSGDTQLDEAFREAQVSGMSLFNNQVAEYRYQLKYKNITVSGSKATVALVMDLDFRYVNAPRSMKSGLYGINYQFSLKKDGSKWVITQVDSDLDEYQAFKNQVETQMKQNATLTKSDAVFKVRTNFKNNLERIRYNNFYLKGNATLTEKETVIDDTGSVDEKLPTGKSIYLSIEEYNYSPTAAVAYAQRYAQSSTDSRLFYTYKNADCTNYISQCIWAGYVGFNANALSKARTYITKKTGMDPYDWYGGTEGGADNWINVDYLCSYLAKAKVFGPKATVYNNGGKYTGVAAGSIKIGDILQFSKGSRSDYTHSVIVTAKDNTVASYGNLYISSHSNDRLNYSLATVISGFGGDYNNCYMRRLVMQSGCYMK